MLIDFFRLTVLGSISGAKAYLDEMSRALPHLRAQAVSETKARAQAETWDYSDYDCSMQEIEAVFDYTMPKILAHSFIIYLHATVEHNLSLVASDVRERLSLALKHNEIAGSPVERTRLYLGKVAAIDVASLEGWGHLRDIAKIRDVVVHRGGQLGTDAADRKRLRELSSRAGALLTSSAGWDDPSAELMFDHKFCKFAVKQAYTFFEALLDRTRPGKEPTKPVDG